MDLDYLDINVTLDFEIDFTNGSRLYIPDCYPKPNSPSEKLFLELWPDQYEIWITKSSFGQPRKISWPQILNVVYHSVRQLTTLENPKEQTLDGVFWQWMRGAKTGSSASRAANRMNKYHEKGLLPPGEWKFAHERNGYDDGNEWLICGGYMPKRFSDIENIKRIPPALRSELLKMLHNYAQKKIEATQDGS